LVNPVVYLQLRSSPHPGGHYCLKSLMPNGTTIGFSIEISDQKKIKPHPLPAGGGYRIASAS
jgi:hypothetical protein